MWIRSQDNMYLIKSKCVGIKTHMNKERVIKYRIFNSEMNVGRYILGEYSSKEKALKVLDMIETKMRQSFHDTTMIVFQMPSDEEVEM